MNTRSLATALVLAAGSFLGTAHAATLATLDTVQVRPAPEQIAQRQHEHASAIPTLEAVQVRPSADLRAEAAGAERIVTLAAVQVRPDAGLRGVRPAHSTKAPAAADAVATLVGQVIVQLPMPHLQASPVELEALLGDLARNAAHY